MIIEKQKKKKIFQQHEKVDFDICILVTSSIAGVSSLFLFCYFGRLATEIYGQMSYCLYESNWQSWPLDAQKTHLVLMIQNANRTLKYHGIGIFTLNLETFCMVSFDKTLFSRSIQSK